MMGKGVQLPLGASPLQTATLQLLVPLGSSVSPHFGLFMKVMREVHSMMSSDLVSLSLAASWSASLCVHVEWPGTALCS